MRVALLCPDLLFGSKVAGALRAAGHEVVAAEGPADALVVDLTSEVDERLRAATAADVPVVAFYSHVEQDTRARADEAGFDLVVPRSRMAREMGALVDKLAPA